MKRMTGVVAAALVMAVAAAGMAETVGQTVGQKVGQMEGPPAVKAPDRARRAKALELLAKAEMSGEDSLAEFWIREDAGAVAGSLGDMKLVKSAVDHEPDVYQKIAIYTAAAKEQSAYGDVAGAKRTAAAAAALMPAADKAPAAPPATEPSVLDDRSDAQKAVGESQIAGEDFAGALATAASMKTRPEQAELYGEIGTAQGKQKAGSGAASFAKAEAVIGKLTEDQRIEYGLDDLAIAKAKAGDVAGAQKMAGAAKDPMDRARPLAWGAMELAEDGRAAEAREMLASATAALKVASAGTLDPGDRVSVELELARAEGALGDKAAGEALVKQALAQLKAAPEAATTDRLLRLAIAMDRLGDEDAFRNILPRAEAALPEDKGDRTHALWETADTLSQYGNPWDAADYAEKALASAPMDPMEVAIIGGTTAECIAASRGVDAPLDWITKVPQGETICRRVMYAAAAKGLVESDENPKMKRFRMQAAAGSPAAMVRLGGAYQYGLGVTPDLPLAAVWYRKGADAGSADGMYSLSMLYGDGDGVAKDVDQEFTWCEKAAKAGYPPAMAGLGMLYEKGEGVAKDEAAGIAWIRKAADQKNRFAYYLLGRRYHKGQGVEMDAAQAMTWFQKAAALGDEDAMAEIAALYEQGDGVPKDLATARQWYKKAADGGSDDAAAWLKSHPE